MIIWSDNYMSYRSKAEMNLLELKVGDRVTLTALYHDGGEGPARTKILTNDNDINIYADKSLRARPEGRPVVFFQYIGKGRYQYSSCNLDYDFPTESYTIKDIKIEKKSYP